MNVVDAIVIGVSLGCVYGLVAIGFSLIYRTTGVLNFAQGGFVMVGGMMAAYSATAWGLALPAAALVGIGSAGLMGLLLAFGVIFPLWRRRASSFIVILGTLLFMVALENIVLNTMGSNPLAVPPVSPGLRFEAGPFGVDAQVLWIVLATVALAVALNRYLSSTRGGVAMRACSIDQTVSRTLGISPLRVGLIAIGVAAVIGGLAGVLIGPLQFTAYSVGHAYNIKGFLAAILGGLGNVRGAVVGGIIVGLFEAFVAIYLTTAYLDVLVLLALVVILFVRPQGIFPEVETARHA